MINAALPPVSAVPRQRQPPKSAGALGWWSAAQAAGLMLVGAGFGLVLALSLP